MPRRVLLMACAWLAAVQPMASQSGGPVRAARISGRVIEADGASPLAGARVALEATSRIDAAVDPPIRTARTDANGEFEFADLPAGQYQVTATKTGYLPRTIPRSLGTEGGSVTVRARQAMRLPAIPLIRSGAINGRVVDERGEPLARVPVHARRFQYAPDGSPTVVPAGVSDVTDDLGQVRVYGLPAGDYVVLAANAVDQGATIGLFTAVVSSDIAPTYYPGTLNPGEAQILSLAAGGEASVQFTPTPPSLVRVLGTVRASNGTPAAGLSLRLRSRAADWVAFQDAGAVSADGSFVIARAAPGDYWIDVGRGGAEADAEHASLPISVGTEDLSGITIVTGRGATIRGRVVAEGASERPAYFRVRALSADGGTALDRGRDDGRPEADGSFELAGVSGRVLLVSDIEGWVVTSAIVDGEERADDPIDTTGRGVIDGVEVRVTNRLGTIAGRAIDDRGRPLADHDVIVMRTDPTGPVLQRLRVRRTDADGRFEADLLRPGGYAVGVVAELEPGAQFSPGFQERLRTGGRQLDVAEDARVVLDVPITDGL